MKKILVAVLLTTALGANAFWNSNNMPWGGYQDNGIFGFNPYDYWDPNWYSQEMDNMIDEFDDNRYNNYNRYNGYSNPYRYGNSYTNGPWNNGPWNNAPWGNGYNQSAPVNVNTK